MRRAETIISYKNELQQSSTQLVQKYPSKFYEEKLVNKTAETKPLSNYHARAKITVAKMSTSYIITLNCYYICYVKTCILQQQLDMTVCALTVFSVCVIFVLYT